MQPLKIIDAHAHIFPSNIAAKATENIGKFYGLPMHAPGTSELLLEQGAKIEVSRYLVCSAATVPHQVAPINDFIAEQCGLHPEFVGFATLHPQMEHLFEEIDRIMKLGLKGIKLHADFQQFNTDDPSMFPIYRRLAEYKLPVLMHAGDQTHDFSAPRRIGRVAELFPDLICIAAHFGGYSKWDEAQTYLKLPNVYFDTSSSLFCLSKEDALRLINLFGADKFMFGTDFPMWDHVEELERFLALELSPADRDQILFKTFEQLLGVT